MAVPVIMPKLEMAQESGTIVEWLKKEGDHVEKGEPILTIETDKITIDIEAPASGILVGIKGKPMDVVPVTEVIAYILQPGEEMPEEAKKQAVVAEERSETRATLATPVALKFAESKGIDIAEVRGTGPGGKVTKSDVEAHIASKTEARPARERREVAATPAARRVAREKGIDLLQVKGSGPRGRIQQKDVEDYAASLVPAAEEKVIPLEGMRRTIAERMSRSYRTAPHITFTIRVDMSALLTVRQQMNAEVDKTGTHKVSVTVLLVKAVAWALERHPLVNSSLQEDGIHLRRKINIGFAVALDDGLIVPVVRDANRKRVSVIAQEVAELTEKARNGKLAHPDISEGTFTISNLGPFGVEQFTAIINPPQSAILAVGATQKEVAVDRDDRMVVRPVMRMTLSADHRVLDGAEATRFLLDVKKVLEQPALMLF